MRAVFFKLVGYLAAVAGILALVGFDNIDAFVYWIAGTAWPYLQSILPLTTQNIIAITLMLVGAVSIFLGVGRRDKPLRVLETEITLQFLASQDDKFVRYRVSRNQLIRAETNGVTACYTRATPSPGGHILRAGISGSAQRCNVALDNQVDPLGSSDVGWDIHHVFDAPLPLPWYSRLVPDALLVRDGHERRWPFIGRCATKRRLTIIHDDPVADEEMYFKLRADRYSQQNIKIDVLWPRPMSETEKDGVVARLIKSSGVTKPKLHWYDENHCSVFIRELQQATIGIYWPTQLVATSAITSGGDQQEPELGQ